MKKIYKKQLEVKLGDTIMLGLLSGTAVASVIMESLPLAMLFLGLCLGLALCAHEDDLIKVKEVEVGYIK